MANYFMWDYKCPDSMLKYYPQEAMQNDWNQTLVTQFNFINASLHGARMKKTKIVNVPEKFRGLIESLAFYKPEDSTLSGRYNIVFVENESNYIDVQGVPLKIENFNPTI